ncbi:MAG: DUF1559 domain-containing protein, partial [Armatimonadetes bacterium]|nr:DUF1559 domain-containing protein [Armatimonadota bacterium]
EKARQASCMSNMKQLQLAILQYAQDYDELLPWYADHDCNAGRKLWYQMIFPYTRNSQLTTCPSDPAVAVSIGVNYPHPHRCAVASGVPQPGLALAYVQRPAEVMSLCDTNPGYLVYCRVCYPNGPRAGEPTGRVPTTRHNDGVNVSFLDGHAKWLRADKLLNIPPGGTPERADFERLWGHRLD